MKPAPFEYLRPETVAEALAALDHDDAKIIAGGQSLVPMMNFRLAQPERLVDINRLAELSRVELEGDKLRVGALVRHAQAARDETLAEHFPIIAEAMAHVAHIAIRNRGTMAGSLVHADPSAEWPLLVTLLDAEIEIRGPQAVRRAAPSAFFVEPLVTEIEENELLTGVLLPRLEGAAGTAFDEVSQRAGDFAIVAAGAVVRIAEGAFQEVRLCLGGVADTPLRAEALEAALRGRPAAAEEIEAALDLAAEGVEPNDDLHASADYRLALVPALARRVLTRAMLRATAREQGHGRGASS